jgi:hypothetical protein
MAIAKAQPRDALDWQLNNFKILLKLRRVNFLVGKFEVSRERICHLVLFSIKPLQIIFLDVCLSQ